MWGRICSIHIVHAVLWIGQNSCMCGMKVHIYLSKLPKQHAMFCVILFIQIFYIDNTFVQSFKYDCMLESAPRRQPFLSNEGFLHKQTTGGFDGCSNSGKINVYIILDLLGPCSQSFSGSGSKSGSSFKMNNFWTISHYLFNKTWCLYPLTC